MDVTPYVESLRRDFLTAAGAAGPETRQTAELLSHALGPAARLALMEAVSQAAAEITAEMPDGAVEVRLSGRDLEFRVGAIDHGPAASDPGDEDPSARITLRIPEAVKLRAEEDAARSGASLNTWLVNLIRGATRRRESGVDLSGRPPHSAPARSMSGPRRGTGGI